MNEKEKITVNIQSLLDITKILGAREVPLEVPVECTVRELVSILLEKWGEPLASHLIDNETGELVGHMRLMVNGRSINLMDKMDTVLKDNDYFLIFPPVGGG